MPIYHNGEKVNHVYVKNKEVRSGYYKGNRVYLKTYKLTIHPTPSTAIVTMIDQDGNDTVFDPGSAAANIWLNYTINYTVSAEGYSSVSGEWTATQDEVKYITLSATDRTFTVNMLTPTKADITLLIKKGDVTTDTKTYTNASQVSYTFTNDTGEFTDEGIAWSINADGYNYYSGHWSASQGSKTINVTLTKKTYTVTINPTPSTATVVINGSTRKTYTATHGETVSWSASAPGYTSQSGSFVCTSNTTLTPTLESAGGLRWCFKTNSSYYYTMPNPKVGDQVYAFGPGGGITLPTAAQKLPENTSQLASLTWMLNSKPCYYKVINLYTRGGYDYMEARPYDGDTQLQGDVLIRAYRAVEFDLYS